MNFATAKAVDSSELEDLGRATSQIVHDLKNQLNGIKLYATFLRKRLESEDRPPEELEILAKLITGLDRAALDMTALVHYSQPVTINTQRCNLTHVALEAVPMLAGAPQNELLYGEFDPRALAEALRSLTEHAISRVKSRDQNQIVVNLCRSANSPEALIEWKTNQYQHRQSGSLGKFDSVHAAVATRIIDAHGGRVEFGPDTIRAVLPLTD